MIRSYKIARKNLKNHRTRTFLTVLGVAIGVFVISLVLIISSGLRQSILSQISALGGNITVVRGNNSSATGMSAFSPLNVAPVSNLSDADTQIIAKTSGVEAVSPMIFASGKISGGQNDYSGITIVATNDDFAKVFGLKFASGDWFDETKMSSDEVVLGENLATGLFGTDQAVGQILTLKNHNFIVVGVVKKLDQPVSLAGTDIDKTAFISAKQISALGVNSAGIGQIAVKLSAKNPEKTEQNLRENLAKNHKDKNDFAVMSGAETSEILAGWLETLTAAALIFASISLIVGGIGIMNIMFVSVTERIREIGLRKAVGATRKNIFTQFLAESLLMTIYGGVAGLIFAYLVGYVITLNFSLPLIFDPLVILVGLAVPIAVGIVFGTWPAVRAAQQDPITALKNLN